MIKLSPKGATHCRFRSLHRDPPRVLPEEGKDPFPLTGDFAAVPEGEYVVEFYESSQILPPTDPPLVLNVPPTNAPQGPAHNRQLGLFESPKEPDQPSKDAASDGAPVTVEPKASDLNASRAEKDAPGKTIPAPASVSAPAPAPPAPPDPSVPAKTTVAVPPQKRTSAADPKPESSAHVSSPTVASPAKQDSTESKGDPRPTLPRTEPGGDSAKPTSEAGDSTPRPALAESAQILTHLHANLNQHLEQFGQSKAQIHEAEMLLNEREKFLFLRNHEREKQLFDTNLEREKLLFEATLEREKLLFERDKQRLTTSIEAEKTIRDASRAIWKEALDATKDRKEAQPKPRADMTLIANTLGVAVVQSVAEIWRASVGSGKKKKKKKKKERDPAETSEKSETPTAVVKAKSTEEADQRASLLLDELLKFANPLELQQVLNDEDAAQRFKDRIDAIRQAKTSAKPADEEAE